jgi:Zn-dependent alcohol dehydrogenase
LPTRLSSKSLDCSPSSSIDIIFGKKIIGSIGGDINIEKNLSLFRKILKKFPLLKNFFSKKKYKLKDINLAINDLKNGKVLRPLIEVDKI